MTDWRVRPVAMCSTPTLCAILALPSSRLVEEAQYNRLSVGGVQMVA